MQKFCGDWMTSKQPSKMMVEAGICLRKAVREELRKKALLGQYVVINRSIATAKPAVSPPKRH